MTTQSAPLPGSQFGYPGQTIPIFQEDDTFGLGFTPSQGSQTNINGILPLRKTDVLSCVDAHFVMDITNGGTTAPTPSSYAPYSLAGSISVSSQNQVKFIDSVPGIDLFVVNQVHPVFPKRNISTPYTPPISVQNTIPGQAAPTTAGYVGTVHLTLPLGLWFENYLDIALANGAVMAPGHGAFVSPQYMSGTKTIQPKVTINPLIGTDFSNGLFFGGSAPTSTGTGVLNLRRNGWLQTAQQFLPLVYGVQRNIVSQSVPIGSATKTKITLPEIGQVGWIGLRFHDPTSQANSLTPPVSTLSLKIAGGVYRFQDDPATNQGRLLSQHGVVLPQGTLGWDLWLDEHGRRNNKYGLDTIHTAAPTVEIEMSTALSAEAEIIVTYDALSWIG